ncbi:MAG: tRNA uridine-5-carboxymethylaminomethyl(34) synthesis GTPase MnmE [Verrucomicrobiota bacterium]
MSAVIVAIATPPGTGALSVVRLSGAGCFEVGERVLRRFSVSKMGARRAGWDQVVDEEGEVIDEVVATAFVGPASFTGEDTLELVGHGGVVVTRMVLERCLEAGSRLAEGGEFSQRAFLNGKLDLTQAEAVMDLIGAQTELAARAAREQLAGKLGEEVEVMRARLIEVVAHVEAYIDFPDEDISPETGEALAGSFREVMAGLGGLLDTAKQGRILREGARVAIIGKPNAGKSSLLNALLGFERAIVSAEAGTTRDTVEEVLDVEGLPVRVIDTAGLREGEGEIEREGIERARESSERADVVIELVDASEARGERFEEGSLFVLNKVDLGEHEDWDGVQGMRVSARTGTGLEELRGALAEALGRQEIESSSGALIAINARHQDCLRRARAGVEEALTMLEAGTEPEFVAVPLREALMAVGVVGGVVDTEEILGSIFGQFCIGK